MAFSPARLRRVFWSRAPTPRRCTLDLDGRRRGGPMHAGGGRPAAGGCGQRSGDGDIGQEVAKMPATAGVNFRTVVHAGSSGIANASPDVCKTPSPAGPTP